MATSKLVRIDGFELIEEGKFDEAVTNQTRRVKWLFENSNKNTEVIDEKLVRLIVLKNKIEELEEEIRTLKNRASLAESRSGRPPQW